MNFRNKLHIAVEGCVGVGKTTLAGLLAKERSAEMILEAFEKNPFLEEFYASPSENVLETEMQFLLLHYHQLKKVRKSDAREIITDFSFYKDLVFAEMNVFEKAEKAMFQELYHFLSAKLSPPDLVIFLKGSDDLIIERIRRRNRSIEVQSEMDYFRKLNRQYEASFQKYAGPIYYVDADRFDWFKESNLISKLSKIIDLLGTGKLPELDSDFHANKDAKLV